MTHSVEPAILRQVDDLVVGTRLLNEDYGRGEVVAFVATGVQVLWHKAGDDGVAEVHLMVHDRSWLLDQRRP